jgi:predicted RNase H-like HicB family nuclease
MQLMQLRVVFEPSEEGGYTAHVPALPGCISEGDTLDDARRNILEAIMLYLEPPDEPVPAVSGRPAPSKGAFVEEIAV